MKTGKTLVELAAEIERQSNLKYDLVAPTELMEMVLQRTAEEAAQDVPPHLAFRVGGDTFKGVREFAHDQLGGHVGIPGRYYDRMKVEAPELLLQNVNHWLGEQSVNRLVRTLDGEVRAFLSDTYRPLENDDLAQAVLPTLLEMELEIVSSEITDRRLYIKAVDKRINRDIPKGAKMGDGSHHIFDTVSPALIVSNSEVGSGTLSIESGIWTRACTNLAVFSAQGMKRRHVGTRHVLDGEDVVKLLSAEAREADDRAIWLKVRDVVRGAFDEARFNANVDRLAETAQQKLEAPVVQVVEFSAKKWGFNETEKASILQHIIEGADLTRYGLLNAITRTAEDASSYDRASELEKVGGQIIDLPQAEWRGVSNANGALPKAA